MEIKIDNRSSFSELRKYNGFTLEQCATLFKITLRTCQNYEKRNNAPEAIRKCLLLYGGKLDFIGETWNNYRITLDGRIISPAGNHIHAHEIDALDYLYKAADQDRTLTLRALKNRKPTSIDKRSNVLPLKRIVRGGRERV